MSKLPYKIVFKSDSLVWPKSDSLVWPKWVPEHEVQGMKRPANLPQYTGSSSASFSGPSGREMHRQHNGGALVNEGPTSPQLSRSMPQLSSGHRDTSTKAPPPD